MKESKQRELSKRLFKDMYVEVALDAYPFGAMFECVVCDYWFRCDVDLCVEYFDKGFPRHCNETMKISKVKE